MRGRQQTHTSLAEMAEHSGVGIDADAWMEEQKRTAHAAIDHLDTNAADVDEGYSRGTIRHSKRFLLHNSRPRLRGDDNGRALPIPQLL
jgi:hypothetical protein